MKNWSHPFKDKRDPLMQLTHMARAKAGFYPLGRNGLWHGGVHFDSGTAGPLDQSSVQCLADGEVVAYRIDTHSPTTPYIVNKQSVEKPFSRNFVLVRHRLQPPKIEGNPDTPPSLTFYSLYMHLRDWASYEADAALQRPAFWPERNLRVRADVSNTRVGTSTPKGLIVLTKPAEGGHMLHLDLLPPGTPVVVSGEGKYRKLEHSRGPASLCNADGSLQGYVAFRNLDHVSGETYRVSSSGDHTNVRSRFDLNGRDLLILRQGTEITISGEGEFRKLESISQYVLAASLQGEPAALTDQVVVLDQPVPIKAGNLIGHIGQYHECRAEHPEEKLHLEVFSGDDVDIFIEASRAWAKRLPDKDKTWLKLAKGTAVVTHEDNPTAARLQMASASSPLSAADLLLPKSVLDALPADRKIQVPASPSHNARTWYRLDGLLHDADNNLLDGWVREEVGVTPWLSPWSWEGYDIIYDYGTPRHALASFFSNIRQFNETQLERYRPMADAEDKGPVKSRLFDIIDRNRDGKMTAEELQAAITLPAHAQSISQLIIHKESEWYHQSQKWDALDELLGHSGSTPHLNWLAEKQRIKQISWWSEVAEKVGLPSWGKVFHFHPIGLVTNFPAKDKCACGCCFGANFVTTRYGQQYGPVYWGKLKLADFKGWNDLVNRGIVTTGERAILVAMSENEGNLDALQSYDSEILTAGAMQKTINPQGSGELSQQVYEFKQEHPGLYQSLFMACGWEVRTENGRPFLYYNGITGTHLKTLLRNGFDQASFESKTKLKSKPLAVFAHAITTNEYITKQVMDFVRRLRTSNSVTPTGYRPRIISDYIRSNLGKAIVLDHHVNRPGNVANDFGNALEILYNMHPTLTDNPAHWGVNHTEHETTLLEIYGPSRRMTDADLRYKSLKNKL